MLNRLIHPLESKDMNIYQISKKISHFLTILVCVLNYSSADLFAQPFVGLPLVQNFTPSDLSQRDENTSVTQDSRGFVYVANINGILEFDGNQWRIMHITGTPYLAKGRRDKIYFAGFNRIGYIDKDAHGRNQLKSIADTSGLRCGQISSIAAGNDNILFATETQAFIYKEGRGITKVFQGRNVAALSSGSDLFITCSDGLFSMDATTLEVKKIVREPVSTIIRRGRETVCFTHNKIIVLTSSFQISTRNWLPYKLSKIRTAVLLPDNTIAAGTNADGIVFFSDKLDIVQTLSSRNGLQNNRVNSLYSDIYGNLWAALSSGVARIEIPSAYSFFSPNNGLEGKVTSLVSYGQDFFASTTSGIYSLGRNQTDRAEKIYSQANVIFFIGNKLYAGTDAGLYADIINGPWRIQNQPVHGAYVPPNQNLIAFLATENMVQVCRFKNGKCTVIREYGPFPDMVRSMAYDSIGNLWMGTRYAGLFVAHSDSVGLLSKAVAIGSGSGLPQPADWIEVVPTTKGVVFSTIAGIYRYDNDLKLFYRDRYIPLPANAQHARISPIVEDKEKNLWLGIGGANDFSRQIAVAWNVDGKANYTLINQPFAKSNQFVSDVIFPDKNFVVWFGGHEGVMRLDFTKVQRDTAQTRTYIRSVRLGEDSIAYENTEYLSFLHNKPAQLAPSIRAVRFQFVCPYYTSKTKLKYQHRLIGLNNAWSSPDATDYIDYERLPRGKYTFEVRAVDELGNVSEPACFEFYANRPFYMTVYAVIIYVLLAIFLLIIFFKWRSYQFAKERDTLESIISSRTEDLLLEKEKTERLLSNILPERTVKELKDKGRSQSMRFDLVTVLFSDIQGFTRIAEQMNPDTLVDELDRFFLQFDSIVGNYNIEKIKTIGDAYMCAGGIPQKNRSNPLEVIIAALEIQCFVKDMQVKANLIGGEYWGLRIGIHTGPVVAGVIGSKKFTYDIWGDTVNIASRMESSGEVGKINISEDTYTLVNEYFDCEYRGRMPAKYKGEIAMYFVTGFKATMTEDPIRQLANKIFTDKLALRRYEDLEEYVLDRIEKELPAIYSYHCVRHTIDVIVSVEIIGRGEGITDEELLLLKIAALFHDSGFIVDYRDHEQLGIQLANDILPKFGYSQQQVRTVGDLIHATRLPANPKNRLEEILCDADLDYLGRSDYGTVSRDLYHELQGIGILKKNEFEWIKLQIKFLQSHQYFTNTAKALRINNKNNQLKALVEHHSSYEENARSARTKN